MHNENNRFIESLSSLLFCLCTQPHKRISRIAPGLLYLETRFFFWTKPFLSKKCKPYYFKCFWSCNVVKISNCSWFWSVWFHCGHILLVELNELCSFVLPKLFTTQLQATCVKAICPCISKSWNKEWSQERSGMSGKQWFSTEGAGTEGNKYEHARGNM